MRLVRALVLGSAAISALWPVAAAAAPDDDTIDISIYERKMKVLTDGKGHYVAVMPFTISDGPDTGYLWYGDGKDFWAQRRFGGGRNGNESFDSTFWEPRVDAGYKANFGYKNGKYTVQCGERITELTPLPMEEAQAMLDSATFHKTRWKRMAYALARDNRGIYYYVDRMREPPDSKDFRIYRGQKGALKPLKMTNVVSDTEGDIFVTRAGRLRLVLDRKETVWLEGKKATKLTPLDPGDNHVLIYSELGVYEGEPLGTPCDDL